MPVYGPGIEKETEGVALVCRRHGLPVIPLAPLQVPEILLDSPSPRPESAHLAPESVLTLLRNPCSPWSGALRPFRCILSTANSMTSSCRAKTSVPDARREEMRTLSCRLKPATSLLFMLGMMTLAASSPSAAQGVCRGFDRKHTITRLGGSNAFSPGGTHTRTRAELQEFFAANAEEIRGILASRGLGDEVANALLDALRQDTGITERTMRDGERLQWMAYRRHGKAKTIEDVCLDLPGAAPAFVITLPMVTAAETARADCSIDVTTDLQPGGPSTIRVRTAPGARATMEGPAGSRTIIEEGASSWTGPWDDPYRADYAFTVTNEGATTETITTYTLLVPRECLNLAFLGRTEEQRSGKRETCSERRTVPRPPPPPPPSTSTCDKLVLDKTEARPGDVVSYQVTGKWVNLELEVLLDGEKLPDVRLTGESGTLAL